MPHVLPLLPLFLAVGACEHTTPFSVSDYAPTAPLAPGNPTRLTYSTGADYGASWLPDGSAFLYSQEQSGLDHDRCLALMPGGGGAVTRTICDDGDPDGDSLNAFLSAAVSPGSRIAYVRTAMLAFSGGAGPDNAALVVAPFGNPLAAEVARVLPYISPSGRSVDIASEVAWAGPATLVFLAEQVSYPCTNFGCTTSDTVATGLEIDRVDLGSGSPVLSVVPGTDLAAALTVSGPDTLYFALGGSPQVHQRILSTGADTVVFTLGDTPTGLTAAGARLAATVSGALHVVDLATGMDQVLRASGADAPALSPDGHALVAQVADSANGFVPDLWLWTVP